jgi:hypothetical protein
VPEAAVNKYDFAACRKYQIRLPWKVLPVKAKAVAKSMHKASYCQFRLCILAADCTHVLAAIHV